MIKCYEAVSMVTDEATSQFGFSYYVNEERQNELEYSCDLIDKLAEECHGVSYDVEVDDLTTEVSVTLECEELIVKERDSIFYELLERVNRLKFGLSGENLCIKFTFDSIWDRVIL